MYLRSMNLILSPSELSELKIIQRNVARTPFDVKVICILMLAKNGSSSCVSDFLGIDTSTVYRYLTTFTSGGLDSLLETRHKGYWGMLDSHQLSALRIELKTHLYTDAKGICDWLVVYVSQNRRLFSHWANGLIPY